MYVPLSAFRDDRVIWQLQEVAKNIYVGDMLFVLIVLTFFYRILKDRLSKKGDGDQRFFLCRRNIFLLFIQYFSKFPFATIFFPRSASWLVKRASMIWTHDKTSEPVSYTWCDFEQLSTFLDGLWWSHGTKIWSCTAVSLLFTSFFFLLWFV